MNYTITAQYARGEEKPCAGFNKLDQASAFMTKKSSVDNEEGKKVIYRVYDDNELLHVLNQGNISTSHAKYAEGNVDINNTAPFIFNVRINTMNSSVREIIAQFNDKNDADLFVVCKFEDKNNAHENDLFLIFKGQVLIDTVNKTIITKRKKESSGSGGNGKGSTYSLSPLSMRPTPGGGPADYWVEKRDDDENIK